jgi:hypothetical protein
MFRPAISAPALILGLMSAAVLIGPARAQDDGFGEIPAGNENWKTGPEVGERIPDFAALDQNGVRRSFDDIKGPNGALVFFFRSADW